MDARWKNLVILLALVVAAGAVYLVLGAPAAAQGKQAWSNAGLDPARPAADPAKFAAMSVSQLNSMEASFASDSSAYGQNSYHTVKAVRAFKEYDAAVNATLDIGLDEQCESFALYREVAAKGDALLASLDALPAEGQPRSAGGAVFAYPFLVSKQELRDDVESRKGLVELMEQLC